MKLFFFIFCCFFFVVGADSNESNENNRVRRLSLNQVLTLIAMLEHNLEFNNKSPRLRQLHRLVVENVDKQLNQQCLYCFNVSSFNLLLVILFNFCQHSKKTSNRMSSTFGFVSTIRRMFLKRANT